jgi:hypothetical protein
MSASATLAYAQCPVSGWLQKQAPSGLVKPWQRRWFSVRHPSPPMWNIGRGIFFVFFFSVISKLLNSILGTANTHQWQFALI